RGTDRISAMVMSAVSSVRTPGVLVTVMPRWSAVATSILSTPLPKLAISLSRSPVWLSTEASMRSVTVGTSTSAVLTASASSDWVIGLSSILSLASNNSRMRVSTRSGNLRVTITSGFFRLVIILPLMLDRLRGAGGWFPPGVIQVSLTCSGVTGYGDIGTGAGLVFCTRYPGRDKAGEPRFRPYRRGDRRRVHLCDVASRWTVDTGNYSA